MPNRRDQVSSILATWLLAGSRVRKLGPDHQLNHTSQLEEGIFRRSNRFVSFVEVEVLPKLSAFGTYRLDDSLEAIKEWPDTMFWARIQLTMMAYLANTRSCIDDAGRTVSELLDMYKAHLLYRSKDFSLTELDADFRNRFAETKE
jgi:hypothetical protein